MSEQIPCRKLVTHKNPDQDGILAIWLLQHFGEKKFPGTANAPVVFGRFDKKAEKLEKMGIICVDMGRGRFDHHPQSEFPEECAATLVAKELGIADDPALEIILKSTLETDTKGSTHPLDLSSLIKDLNRQHPPAEVFSIVTKLFDAHYARQNQFWENAKKFDTVAKLEKILVKSEEIRLATIRSSNEMMAKYAWRTDKANIIIQRDENGNTQILSDRKTGITLNEVAQIIRYEERKADGEKEVLTPWELRRNGRITEGDSWYLHKGFSLLNGSKTAPDETPSKLKLTRLKELVKIGLQTQRLAPCCPNSEGEGYRSCLFQGCPWFKWYLPRCEKRRRPNFNL